MNVVVITIAAILFAVHLVKDREVEDVGLKVKEYPKPQPIFENFSFKRPEIFSKLSSNEHVVKLKAQIENRISALKSKIYPIFIVEHEVESAIKSKSRSKIRSN